MSEFQPTPPTPERSQEDRLLAAAAHGSAFLDSGLFVPIIIYFLRKDQSPWVAYQALQSVFFALAFVAISVVTCGLGAVVLVWPYLIFQAIAAFKAFQGERYDLPVVAEYAARSFPDEALEGPGPYRAPEPPTY